MTDQSILTDHGTAVANSVVKPTKPARKMLEKETFGSFIIHDMEFALPVEVVREVVNEPQEVSPVPLCPSYMIGLFNLRGMVVPMIDLREIFGFPACEKPGERKITIIEDGDTLLGLVFDRTGEVIHAHANERVPFKSKENGIKDVVSEGVLNLEGGDRILQILDPYELLKLDKVPRIAKESGHGRLRADRGNRKNCISFEVGHSLYAFDLDHVKEVMEVPEISRSCLSQGKVLGTINMRGSIVPILDFRGFVGKEVTNSQQIFTSQTNKLLVMNIFDGYIGFLVYSIEGIIPYYQEDVLPLSKLAMPSQEIFKGCLTVGSSDLVMLFDHEKTMNQPEIVEAAQYCQEIYSENEEREGEVEVEVVSRRRRTFITFTAHSTFAMDISQVCEVIENPEDLLQPPNAPPSVAGIINLRDDMITLIDLKKLYGYAETIESVQKIVIFECSGEKYGIMVDSVDEIIMTTADKVFPCNDMPWQSANDAASSDVTEMVQIASNSGGVKTVMVLDAVAFVQHSKSS